MLTPQETESLFSILENFKAAGKAIVLITHKLDEVMRVGRSRERHAGRARLVASSPLGETSKSEIAHGIIGGELPRAARRGRRISRGAPVLTVENLEIKGFRPQDRTHQLHRQRTRDRRHRGSGRQRTGRTHRGACRIAAVCAPARAGLLSQDIAGRDVSQRPARWELSYIPTEIGQRVGLALEARVSRENAADRAGAAAALFAAGCSSSVPRSTNLRAN